MARKLIQYVEITDDFDRESPADETIEVAIDGIVYELDLTEVKAKELREFLANYQEVAHDQWKMPTRPGQKRKVVAQAVQAPPRAINAGGRSAAYGEMTRDREARTAIRDWAGKHGTPVAKTGKIPIEVLQAYRESNPNAYIPETTLRDAGLQDA